MISSRKRGCIAALSFCDDEEPIAPMAARAKQLGFAPVKLGRLNEGGALADTRDRIWGQPIFQDLFKKSSNKLTVHCQRCCLPGPVNESPRRLSHNPRSGSGVGFDVPFPPKRIFGCQRGCGLMAAPPRINRAAAVLPLN
jgi:hypothetical protein